MFYVYQVVFLKLNGDLMVLLIQSEIFSTVTGKPGPSDTRWPGMQERGGGVLIPCKYCFKVPYIKASLIIREIEERCKHPCISIKVNVIKICNEIILEI